MRIILKVVFVFLLPIMTTVVAAASDQNNSERSTDQSGEPAVVPPIKPYGPDILGIRLGMSLGEAESLVRENMEVGWVYERNLNDIITEKTHFMAARPYLTLKAFVSLDKKEAFSLYTAPPASEKIIAVSRSVPLGKQDTFQSVTEALKGKYGPTHPNLSQMMSPTWSEVKGRQIHCKATPTFGGTGALSRLKIIEKPPEQFDDKKRKLRNKEPKAIPELAASFRGGKDKSPCLPVLSTFFHRRSLLFGLVDHGPYLKYFKKNLKVIEQRVNSKPLPKPGFKF